MSDQGGHPEPGWYADPDGRHEYRYWDGTSWSDQVSTGGVVSTEPPGEAPTQVTEVAPGTETMGQPAVGPPAMGTPTGPPGIGDQPMYIPPTDTGGSRKLPVGVLALAGVAVAAVVVAVVLLVSGGDDGGQNASTSASDDVSSDGSADITDDFSNDFSDFSDLSDYSGLFSDFSDLSDYSDLFSDFSDFSDLSDLYDFTDAFSDVPIPGAPDAGDPVEPSAFIDEYGTVPRFDRLADSCFDGDLNDCNELYAVTPVSPSTNSYEGYGATCGGRLAEESPGICTTLG